MKIDHIGIAVKNIENAIAYWEKVFEYKQATEVVLNTRQQVLVVFMEKPDSLTVKLIQPSGAFSPLLGFLKKGGSLHHLCFITENLEKKILDFKSLGLISSVAPQPGEAFDNNLIAFFLAKDRLNIELIETEVKANRIK